MNTTFNMLRSTSSARLLFWYFTGSVFWRSLTALLLLSALQVGLQASEPKAEESSTDAVPTWDAPPAPPFWGLIGKYKKENYQNLSQEQFNKILRIAYDFHKITQGIAARGRHATRTDEEFKKQLELLERALQILTPEQRATYEAEKMGERMRRRLNMLIMETTQEEQLKQLAATEITEFIKIPVTEWQARQRFEIEVVKKAIEKILNENQRKIISANADVYQYIKAYELTEGFKYNF